jgi:hypothetical protein
MKKKKKLEKNKFGKILPTDGVFWFDGIGLRRLARARCSAQPAQIARNS